jgi:hypothetical protein
MKKEKNVWSTSPNSTGKKNIEIIKPYIMIKIETHYSIYIYESIITLSFHLSTLKKKIKKIPWVNSRVINKGKWRSIVGVINKKINKLMASGGNKLT